MATVSLFFLVSLLISAVSAAANRRSVTYHGGPLLTGNVSLAILWYGRFDSGEKDVIKTFIESLETPNSRYEPDVSDWWDKVESFSKVAKVKGGGTISVKIAREVDDENESVGKVLTSKNLPTIIDKATAGLANSVAVVFSSSGTCVSDCALHGWIRGKNVISA